jgi:hypothetical protein
MKLGGKEWTRQRRDKMARDRDEKSGAGFVGLYPEEMTWPGASEEEMDALRAAWRVGLTIPKTAEWLLAYRLAQQQPPTEASAPAPDEPAEEDGWQVKRIKTALSVACPNEEHKKMSIRAVRKACESEFENRGWPLPGPDSFSRALGRRRRD